jgi:hypothetical protein
MISTQTRFENIVPFSMPQNGFCLTALLEIFEKYST